MSDSAETTSEAPPSEPREVPSGRPRRQVVVRYGRMAAIGLFRHDLDAPPAVGTMLVARTERGTELGRTLINVGDGPAGRFITRDALESFLRANGSDYDFSRGGRVLRVANPQDLNDQHHLDRSGHEEASWCREQLRQLNMDMKIVDVEHLLGGERIIFFFIAEHRVDFRELVRRLAGQYHTRIEMRQVGARDEARLVADYERCGMRCCCQEYLKLLQPVSMRMAKTQKATLDPTKISGRCGRLMCCLRYEDVTYTDLQKRLPRRNTWVRTADGVVGKVLDGQIITQSVRLMLPNGSYAAVAVDQIAERGVPEPTRPEAPPPRPPRPEPARRTLLRDEAEKVTIDEMDATLDKMMSVPADEDDAGQVAAGVGAKTEQPVPAGEQTGDAARQERRGRRKRRRKPGQQQAQGQAPSRPPTRRHGHPEALSVPPRPGGGQPGQGSPTQGPSGQASPGGKSRKRRRRKRKPGGGGGGSADGGDSAG